jgi:hypothetical protein
MAGNTCRTLTSSPRERNALVAGGAMRSMASRRMD